MYENASGICGHACSSPKIWDTFNLEDLNQVIQPGVHDTAHNSDLRRLYSTKTIVY